MNQALNNCIVVHGCPESPEKDREEKYRYYHHWIPWLKKELIKNKIKTDTPLMPDAWHPDYQKFKKEFQKYEVTKNTILVGHSCGCAFLVRWLGETKKEVKKLILVTPWKIPNTNDGYRKKFYEFTIDKSINKRVRKIVMFTSDIDGQNAKESLAIYTNSLNGQVIELKGMGHFCVEDMGTEQFPELLKEIIS